MVLLSRQTMMSEMLEMGLDPMAEIRALGYEFRDGQLREVEGNGTFMWQGQTHYEALADAVSQYVPLLLEEEAQLRPLWLPLGATPGEGCPIFVSEGYDKADRLLLIIQGMGKVRAGVWGCSLCINNSLETGTMLPYLRRAAAAGYGVVVFNPNENTADGVPVYGSENFTSHVKYVMDNVVSQCAANKINILAHSHGGRALVSYLGTAGGSNLALTLTKRIHRLVFTDSYHVQGQLAYLPNCAKALLNDASRTVNFVPDSAPLGARVEEWASQEYAFSEVEKGCLCRSSGVLDHPSTNYAAMGAVFEFLDTGDCGSAADSPQCSIRSSFSSPRSNSIAITRSFSLDCEINNPLTDLSDNPVINLSEEWNLVVDTVLRKEDQINANTITAINANTIKGKKDGHWSRFKNILSSSMPMKKAPTRVIAI